jgi:hypothetical protein
VLFAGGGREVGIGDLIGFGPAWGAFGVLLCRPSCMVALSLRGAWLYFLFLLTPVRGGSHFLCRSPKKVTKESGWGADSVRT